MFFFTLRGANAKPTWHCKRMQLSMACAQSFAQGRSVPATTRFLCCVFARPWRRRGATQRGKRRKIREKNSEEEVLRLLNTFKFF